ncbi:MAG: hypothetical protein J6T48_10000 [Bacteroidales bacterium]|nr:hypothetical protein [Bacteroidales bacterium]
MNKVVVSILLFSLLSANMWAVNPPGTKKVKIGKETIYVDQEEIRVADWLEYIRYLEHKYGKESDEVRSAYPEGITEKELVMKKKLTHPVTDITLEQATEYSRWRTDVVNSVNEETGMGKVQYILPTEEQYLKLIRTFGSYEILSDKNKTERIVGLQSGVLELTSDGSVLKNNGTFSKDEKVPGSNVGFRCIALVSKDKK